MQYLLTKVWWPLSLISFSICWSIYFPGVGWIIKWKLEITNSQSNGISKYCICAETALYYCLREIPTTVNRKGKERKICALKFIKHKSRYQFLIIYNFDVYVEYHRITIFLLILKMQHLGSELTPPMWLASKATVLTSQICNVSRVI